MTDIMYVWLSFPVFRGLTPGSLVSKIPNQFNDSEYLIVFPWIELRILAAETVI